MLKVVFCHDGQAVNDFHACDFVDGTIKTYQRTCVGEQDMMVRFSTECVLDAFVLRAMKDEVLTERIEFYYRGPDMNSDVKVEFNEVRGLEIPDGVKDIGVRYYMTNEILRLGYEKLKTKHKLEK